MIARVLVELAVATVLLVALLAAVVLLDAVLNGRPS
jgi:hypothetical protein